MADYEVIVVGPPTAADAGQPRENLATAEIERIAWELNGAGLCTFRMALTDTRATKVKLLETEILVTRNGRKIFRGIPVRAEADEKYVRFQCPGLLWYFSKRFVGDANRPNLLTNGSFETDSAGTGVPTGWNVGPDAFETITRVEGKSAQDGDRYITLEETRTVSTWTQSDGSGAATVEDVTAKLLARTSQTKSGTAATIDGVGVTAGDRVLLTNQSDSKSNGIWVVAAGAWSRATNFDSDAEIRGKRVKITHGNLYADTGWRNTNDKAITIDDTAVSFSQYAYTKITSRDSRIQQTMTPTPGKRYTFRGWFRITDWDAAPYRDRGVWLRVFRNDNDKQYASAVFRINRETPRDQWGRAEVTVKVPRDADPTQVRLRTAIYGVRGTIQWDACRLVTRDYVLDGETDRVAAMKTLVTHAQNTTYGKTTLNISTSGTNTGNLTNKRFPHDEHANILDSLLELAAGSEGPDFYIDEDTRTFTVDSKRGTLKPEFALDMGGAIAGFSYQQDGAATANAIVVLAPGDGPDREEGYAKSLGLFEGMAYEQVVPLRSHHKELKLRAQGLLNRRNRLVEHITVTTDPERGGRALIDNLQVGDRVPVRVVRGYVDLEITGRIWGIDLDPRTEVMTLRLNEDA